MEAIKGHPEHVETVFGEAIVSRDESLVVLAGACGLGPPDLCWLQKAPKSALTGSSGDAKGYYHYCLGVDASSSAAVAAYFATLTSMVEAPTFLQGLFSTSETRIERGFYCCYDPLSRLDVRCELCIPGGVVCGALDCEGNVHDVTPDLWRNCVVATFLRSELYDAELVSYSKAPVARHPPLPTPADESRLLSAIAGLYEDGVLPGALEALTVDQAGGVAPEHSDVVLHTLLHYLARRQRWGTAMDFFARLSAVYPAASLYVAAVQRECGLYDDALATLSRAVDAAPDEPLLLAALATECLYAEQHEAALRFATRAARMRPLLRPAWLALARAHVRLGAAAAAAASSGGAGGGVIEAFASAGGAAALVVLNLVPPPPLPGREEAMLHVVVAPEPKSVTKPSVPPYDLDVAIARQVLSEEAYVHPHHDSSVGGSSASGPQPPGPPTLPGALLVPREAPDGGPCPDTAPLRITKAVLAAVYTVLQELVAVCSWDGFLALRSAVFVMHADSDVLQAQQREAEERERQLRLLHRQLSAALPPSPGRGPAPPHIASVRPPAGGAGMHRRPPPEGTDFEAALDEAVAMGLADYPEHLDEVGYDDPRVVAAREAHRRHLREIAERQARLEAAEGGAYADDEWDGSSSGGEGGGGVGKEAVEGGEGSGRGGRSRRGNRAGRKAPGRRGASPGPGSGPQAALAAAAPQPQDRSGDAGAGDEDGQPAPVLGGVVDASELVRQEMEEAAAEAEAEAQRQQAAEAEVAEPQGQSPPSPSVTTPAGAPATAAAAPTPAAAAAATSPAPSSWWGTWFGGGGGGSAGAAQPQRREPGPLGEACEGRTGAAAWAGCRSLGQLACSGSAPAALPAAGPCCGAARAPTQGAEVSEMLAALLAAAAAARRVQVEAVVGRSAAEEEDQGSWWQPAEPMPGSSLPASHVVCAPLQPLACSASRQPASAPGDAGAHGLPSPSCVAPPSRRRLGGLSPKLMAVCALAARAAAVVRQRHRQQSRKRQLQQRDRCVRALLEEAGGSSYGSAAPLLPARGPSSATSGNPLGTAARCLVPSCSRQTRISISPGPVAESGAAGNDPAADPAAAAPAAAPSEQPSSDPAAASHNADALPRPAPEPFPLLLQNPDADRHLVLQGMDATELGAKRLCVRWLDELIVALWHDLQSFLDWKALDGELAEAGFRSHAEIVAGTAPTPTPDDYARPRPSSTSAPGDEAGTGTGLEADGAPESSRPLPPPPPALPPLSAVDWLRRALLAERLHHEADALAAYLAAISTPPTAAAGAAAGAGGALFAALPGGGPGASSMIAWQAIMRLAPAAEPRDTASALRAVQAVLAWLEARAPPAAGSAAGPLPFTAGYLSASANPAAAGVRPAPAPAGAAAAAAVPARPGKLQACPLSVLHCLYMVAAVLEEQGVETAIAAAAAASMAAAAGKRGGSGGGRGGGVGAPAVHPVAATVLRQAVQVAAAARAATASSAGGGGVAVGAADGVAAPSAGRSSAGGFVSAGAVAASGAARQTVADAGSR